MSFIRYYELLPFDPLEYPLSCSLSFRRRAFIRHSVSNSRFCLVCPSTRITRHSSSPRRVSLSRCRREYLETFAIPSLFPLSLFRGQHVSAQQERPSILWSCRGKSEAITLGFYPGLPTRRGWARAVANKRVKRKATEEQRTLRLHRIKRRLCLFHRLHSCRDRVTLQPRLLSSATPAKERERDRDSGEERVHLHRGFSTWRKSTDG